MHSGRSQGSLRCRITTCQQNCVPFCGKYSIWYEWQTAGRVHPIVGPEIGKAAHISPCLKSMEAVSNSTDAARRFLSNGDEMIVLACQQTVLMYYCNCSKWYSPGMRGPGAAVTVKVNPGPIRTGSWNWLVRRQVLHAQEEQRRS